MSSFSSELGAHFGTCLEAPHVIDVDAQLWAAVISKGPDGYPLNSSFKTADAYTFQDSLGSSLERICKVVPGGCLVFFPSYKAMDKLCNRWKETGQWDRLNAEKPLFIEPRGGNQDGLEQVLKGYYSSIHQGSRPVARSKKRAKKLDSQDMKSAESFRMAKKGAAFLAVCRGKISEGIDFSDDNARVVIVVGIPFPNIRDIKVAQKKKFNDTFKSSKNLLNGSEWYCQQAFRALNQATGRCIRHRYDYGGIILLDERFCEERNKAYLSKWFRKSIRQYDSFENSIHDLSSFFIDVKDRVGKVPRSSQQLNVEIEDISFSNNDKDTDTKKNSGGVKANYPEMMLSSDSLVTQKDVSFCQSDVKYESPFSQGSPNVNRPMLKNESRSTGYREYIDLECDTPNGYRNLESTPWDPDLTIVRETPGLNGSPPATVSKYFARKECSSLGVTPSVSELPGPLYSSPISVVNSSYAPKPISLVTSPEILINIEENDDAPRTQSPYHLSVNSSFHKRRKSFKLSSESPQAMQSGTPILRSPNCATSMEERLQISCSVCKTPLGLPSNDLFVTCSSITSSKVHLTSVLKMKMLSLDEGSPGVPVIIADISSVNQRILENKDRSPQCNEGIAEGHRQGVWCKEDGCVFDTIFCPFCSDSNSCLGVQVMATDASNVCLQNKIMLFSSGVETKDPAAFKDPLKDEKKQENLPSGDSTITKSAALNSIEKFAYVPQQQHSEGWRSTKSKMRLPKRTHLSTPEG